MDQLPVCSLACPATEVCVFRDRQQHCLPKCTENSNYVATSLDCGCQTAKAGKHTFVQAGRYCINGVASSKPQCADHATPTRECYCASALKTGCANQDSVCYLGKCYYASCSAASYHQGYQCKCGADYIQAGEFCAGSQRLDACAAHQLVSNCGCSRSGLEKCGQNSGMYACEAGVCRQLAKCVNQQVVNFGEECGCCSARGECTFCGAGSTCANGACLCATTDVAPDAASSACVCGAQRCEYTQYCHNGQCYDLVASGTENPADSGKEVLCKGRKADGTYLFGVIPPGSYCTVAGLPSSNPMCPPYGSLADGLCVCSKTSVETCNIRVNGPSAQNCLQHTDSKQNEYLCLQMCSQSGNPVSSQCICSLSQGIAEIGDICLAGKPEQQLFPRCTLKHFQMQAGNACYCGSLSQLCAKNAYCSPEQKKCVVPPKCEEGVVKQEFCQTQQGLCQGGNYLDKGQCFCALDQPITARGVPCLCGVSACGKEVSDEILYCINKQCLPSCVGDGRPEERLCGCPQGNTVKIAGPEEALNACFPFCSEGFFFDAEQNYCVSCDAACAKCTALTCTKCASSIAKLVDGQCVKQANRLAIFVAVVVCAIILVAVGVVATFFVLSKRAKRLSSRSSPREMRKTNIVVEEAGDDANDAEQ